MTVRCVLQAKAASSNDDDDDDDSEPAEDMDAFEEAGMLDMDEDEVHNSLISHETRKAVR